MERKHRYIVDTGHAVMTHASLPPHFWAEAFDTTVYLINLLPSPSLQNKLSFFQIYHRHRNYHFLKVFGCKCFSNLRPYNKHKINF